MTFWMTVSDFIGLCIVIADYNLDISIDELMIRWDHKIQPKRRLRNEVTSFPEYLLLCAINLEYISYAEMDALYHVITGIPGQKTILSGITLKQWIILLARYIVIDSNDSDDLISTAESYGKMNSIELDMYFRRDLCGMEDPIAQMGSIFNKTFRSMIGDPERYAPDTITKYVKSCVYAQMILELWTEPET